MLTYLITRTVAFIEDSNKIKMHIQFEQILSVTLPQTNSFNNIHAVLNLKVLMCSIVKYICHIGSWWSKDPILWFLFLSAFTYKPFCILIACCIISTSCAYVCYYRHICFFRGFGGHCFAHVNFYQFTKQRSCSLFALPE